METYLSNFSKIKDKIEKELKQKTTKDKDTIVLSNLFKDAENCLNDLNTEYSMISTENRIKYRSIIENASQQLHTLNRKYKSFDTQKSLESKDKEKDKKDMKVDHIVRYDNEGNRVIKQVGVMQDSENNMREGIKELRRQGGQIDEMDIKLGETEKHLTVHQQFFNIVKNKALFSRLKLIGIVILLFIADIMVLYLKFS